MKKAILALSLCMSLMACEDTGKPQDVPKPDNNTESVGPYDVTFSGKDQSYTHSFNISPHDDEGAVDYHITTPASVDIQFVDTRLQVAGCPVSSVKHQVYWLQDANQPLVQMLKVGETFRTRAGMKGIFRHFIRGLGGCNSMSLTTNIKVKPQIARTCNGTLEPATCQVMAYCRQSGTSYYSEVEVWKETRGLVLRKFMNRGDGTRSLQVMADVAKLVQGNITSYNDSYGDASLRIDGVTRAGQFTGVSSSERLDCEL